MSANTVNLIVVFAYLAATAGVGVFMARYVKGGEDFFLGGRALNKWMVAGTIMATNVAAIYLVGPAGAAYAGGGVSVLLIAWTGNMIAALSAAFIVPRLRRLRITTVTDILETRYNRVVRLIPVFYWLIYYALFAGNAVYTLSVSLGSVLKFSADQAQNVAYIILVVGPVVVVYCAFSGLLGQAYTAVMQSFLIILGGVVLLPVALKAVGGISAFAHDVPQSMFLFWRSDGAWPVWKHVVMFAVMGLPYWCTSQYLLQRTFAAKSIRHASRGLALAAVLTGALTICYILPGICGSLIYTGDKALKTADMVLPKLFADFLPIGLGGLFIAALISASNSTASALLNSIATLFTNDIYKPLRPNRSERHYVVIGRAVTVAAGIIGLSYAFMVPRLGGILQANFKIMTFFEPPIFMVVFAAIFWRFATSSGAIACLVGGMVYNAVALFGFKQDDADRTFILFPLCLILMVVVSLVTQKKRAPEKQEAIDTYYRSMSGGRVDRRDRNLWLGGAIAAVSLVLFVLAAVFESCLPKPGSIFIVMGLMTTFVLGVYLLLPAVIGKDEVEEPEAEGGVQASLLNRFFASGRTWLLLYVVSAILMVILYLVVPGRAR